MKIMSILERISEFIVPKDRITLRQCRECKITADTETDICPDCGGDIKKEEVEMIPQYWAVY